MCEWGTDREIVIERRVTVDACLADTIVALNRAGVTTTGCCCGHGEPGVRPSATIHPSAQDRARALGYAVETVPCGDPMIWL